ncbi:putative mitochondrial protein [Vitis vinifera]|uniref:Putative mitochondrial protein n=1 Tax=Vitis vinifera TaxID=29760 RepID=A0A438H885_VITVI|nr:putative mitochondrial protein [Vitis vinifera]
MEEALSCVRKMKEEGIEMSLVTYSILVGGFAKIANAEGLVLNNSESITEEILLYFEKLYSSPPGESWRGEGLDWSPISEESASRDKVPRPDGFTIAMFQDCWDVIKEDLVRVFAEFHKSGIINQSTNASFIVLLPKKSQTKKISDFRPISLITCLYKIIGQSSIRAIKRVLVNGNAKGWVKATRGLRQVDPLSPFLFTIVTDVLSRMLLRAKERSLLEGFRVGRNRTSVSHLQFADDTIFFSNTCAEDLQTLKSLLLVFGQISGIKVNLDKSNLFGINLDQNHLSRLALMLDCKASDWPILYPGLPLGGNSKACGF